MKARLVPESLRRMSLSARILLGLGLGVSTGLFFGEAAAVFQPVADVYIRLMQMTVLPYLVLALVIGLGQLEAGEARRLAARAGAILLATWAVTLAVIAALPATFPQIQSASFFSTSLVQPPEPFSIPDLYFTSNPFHALAYAIVPAVVLFSSMLGVAVMRVGGREGLLDTLRVLEASVVKVTRFVVGLTPLGVFAIAAVTAGTMTLQTVVRLQVYLVAFAAAALLLAFWILPLLVTATTPFTYREVVGVAREALLTAFVTSNAFIVLPILVERSKALLRERGLLNPDSDSAAEVLVPIFFNFPNAGPLLTLLFVPFAAWLAGDALSALQYPTLFAVGLPTYFANAQVALPFLMDVFGLPADLFQLYVSTTVLTDKLNAMTSAMNLLVFALLGAAAMGGFLVKDRRRLVRAGTAMAAGVVVVVAGVWLVLASTVDTTYRKDEALRRMHAPRRDYATVVHRDLQSVSAEGALRGPRTLAALRERGTLRIGYDPQNAPLSFFNLDGELVGLDVELGAALAADLGLEAEFVPVRWTRLPEMLAEGTLDVMPSVWYRPIWFSSLNLSEPYMMGTVGLIVRDERRHEFARVEDLRRDGLRVGVPLGVESLASSVRRYFDGADVEFVNVETPLPFLEGRRPDLDAYLYPAESGAAGTLLHPEYTVVVPQPDPVKLPFAFGLPLDSKELAAVVNEWIVYVQGVGRAQRAYDYWILGRGAQEKEPRWSIARNVLGWGM